MDSLHSHDDHDELLEHMNEFMALSKIEQEMHERDPGFFLREAQDNAELRADAIKKTVQLEVAEHEQQLQK